MDRRKLAALFLILALGWALWPPARPARAAVYTVDTTAEEEDGSCSDGDCSLRDAILLANDNPGPDTITFAIEPAADDGCNVATGVCTIRPDHWLPSLLDGGTTIDGYTQPGALAGSASCPAQILIEIDGVYVTGNNGLNILSPGNTVRGLAIYRFGYNGIAIGGAEATGNLIAGNILGLTAARAPAFGNGLCGIFVGLGATDNTIGGSVPADGNVISGNEEAGVSLHGADTSGNVVTGNLIGMIETGGVGRGNTLDGVYIYGGAHDNWVGGDAEGSGNVIACNGRDGVRVHNSAANAIAGNTIGLQPDGQTVCPNHAYGVTLNSAANTAVGGDGEGERNVISGNRKGVAVGGAGAAGNVISGNCIGTDADGAVDLGNYEEGVWLTAGAHDNVVGGDTAGEGNVISGNGHGVRIDGADTALNSVAGNRIGTDAAGLAALGNSDYGLALFSGAHDNTIGGSTPGERNVIAGNGTAGVVIESAHGNRLVGNYIGTDADGGRALSNGGFNIHIGDGSSANVIGGPTAGRGNVISGAIRAGICIDGGARDTAISGNYIGTDASGTVALPNEEEGIRLEGGTTGNDIGPRNLVSGNGGTGITLWGEGTTGNGIFGNTIGADASGAAVLPNGGHGILVAADSCYNEIGRAEANRSNLIAGNQTGIWLENTIGNTIAGNCVGSPADSPALGNLDGGVVLSAGAQHNTIGPENRIAYNGTDGVTVETATAYGNQITRNAITGNGALGIDLDGGNHDVAPPTILSAGPDPLLIAGTACPGCHVELFASPTDEGEGLVYLAVTEAEAGGEYSLEVAALPHPYLTATATDPANNTSEFSAVYEYEPPLSTVFLPFVPVTHGSSPQTAEVGQAVAVSGPEKSKSSGGVP